MQHSCVLYIRQQYDDQVCVCLCLAERRATFFCDRRKCTCAVRRNNPSTTRSKKADFFQICAKLAKSLSLMAILLMAKIAIKRYASDDQLLDPISFNRILLILFKIVELEDAITFAS